MSEQLHLSVDGASGHQLSASLDLDDSMALFLLAFAVILVVGVGFVAAVIIVKAVTRK